jgi:hypothetical protein
MFGSCRLILGVNPKSLIDEPQGRDGAALTVERVVDGIFKCLYHSGDTD